MFSLLFWGYTICSLFRGIRPCLRDMCPQAPPPVRSFVLAVLCPWTFFIDLNLKRLLQTRKVSSSFEAKNQCRLITAQFHVNDVLWSWTGPSCQLPSWLGEGTINNTVRMLYIDIRYMPMHFCHNLNIWRLREEWHVEHTVQYTPCRHTTMAKPCMQTNKKEKTTRTYSFWDPRNKKRLAMAILPVVRLCISADWVAATHSVAKTKNCIRFVGLEGQDESCEPNNAVVVFLYPIFCNPRFICGHIGKDKQLSRP